MSILDPTPRDVWDVVARRCRPCATRHVGPLLYSLIRVNKARRSVEVGLGEGFCSVSMALAMRENGGRHFVLDNNPRMEKRVAQLNEDFGIEMQFILGDAVDPDLSKLHGVDFVFVDVCANIGNLLRRLGASIGRDGFVVVHDYYYCDAIRKDIDEYFKPEGWEMFKIPCDGENRGSRMAGTFIGRKVIP